MKVNSLLVVAAFAVTSFSTALFSASELSVEQRVQLIETQNNTRSQLQANMSMQLVALQKEVKELRGIIEEHEYKLNQIQERQRDLYRDIENRFSALSTSTNTSNKTAAKTTQPVIGSNVSNQVKQAVNSDDGRAEFEAAFKLVRDKQYTESIQGFQLYLSKYPNSDYSDNARFWIGQVYYAQSNLIEAEKQFNLLRKEFPQSPKLAAALLKLAEIKVKQEQWLDAKALYNQVATNHSGAQQQLARKGLQNIKQSGH